MRGITEGRLKEVFSKLYWSTNDDKELFTALLSECTELNAWQPIDENTPNDRPILLFYPESNNQNEFKRVDFYNGKSELCVNPTHYKELPKVPI